MYSWAARTALLIMVVAACGGCWVIEQPSTSQLTWHPRVQLLWTMMPKAKQGFCFFWVWGVENKTSLMFENRESHSPALHRLIHSGLSGHL